MPRAKQQDQVEARKAAPAAREQVNGTATRRGGDAASAKKAPATKSASVKESAKPEKVAAAAPSAPPSAKAAAGPTTDKAKPARGHKAEETAGHAGHGDKEDKGAAAEPDEARQLFLAHQRELLIAERNNYTRQAEELRAQAEALALEHEPGDVQFDEEGGEGGTSNVDRELDLHLSAQAHAAVEEIDIAMLKIGAGTYGLCESCGTAIPKARLEALPHARLCVSCKSGGLTARRQ
jgi:DnaK suppressor protein